MEFTSAAGRGHYEAVVANLGRTVVGLDFDGTISPIVDEPEDARIHPDAPEVLVRLAAAVLAVAVITGRPARQVLALGGLDEVGDAVGELDKDLYVFGQYGNERWSSHRRRVISPRPPHGLSTFERDLPSVLRRADAAAAFVEEKGLAVAVHTRRLPDPAAAFKRLVEPLRRLAADHDLTIEPGRNVIEVRSPGMTKGHAVRTLVDETDPGAFVFCGDDLGDIDAFETLLALREEGMPTLLVCSASAEESTLADLADVVVPGPEGVLALLRGLAEGRDA